MIIRIIIRINKEENIKYSDRYNERILEIYRDIEDKEIFNNIDVDMRDVAIILKIRKRDEIKTKEDHDKSNTNINTKEVVYKEK